MISSTHCRSLLRLLLVIAAKAVVVQADIVYENEEIKLEEIFDLDYARASNVSVMEAYSYENKTSYYCTFRSHWDAINQPALYPELARWGSPIMFSHTKQHIPFIRKREATSGVEQIAENAISSVFLEQNKAAGELVGETIEGKGFFINQKKWDDNYVYLPPLEVSAAHPYISGIAAISPSPDWYTAFYLFDSMKESTGTFWESFKIRSYPWDAGTDDGTLYTSQDRDTDPAQYVTRIEVGMTVDNVLLNAAGDKVPYVAEWECVLHTCPVETPDCEKPNWPPANNCDVLRYPQCNTPCDPSIPENICEQCKRESNTEEKVYYKNCCLAGREPKDGTCDGEGGTSKTETGTSNATTTRYYYITIMMTSIIAVVVSCF